MPTIQKEIIAIATLVNEQVTYIKGFSHSTNTNAVTGKLLIPHFTADKKQAWDFPTVEIAVATIVDIIDYQVRYYQVTTLRIDTGIPVF